MTRHPSSQEQPDFTLARYRADLAQTLAAYPPVGFDVLGDPGLAQKRFCLVRHDIDVSPSAALAMARIEAELGLRATYTVLLSGRFYSPFEPEVRDALLEIVALGHEIGLHFDAVWQGVDDESALAEGVRWQASVLERLLASPVRMFSFHDTTPFALSCKAASYGGLWNAYAGPLWSACSYVSDSNGYWRFRSWSQALEQQPERLYLLTHPEWWVHGGLSPAERIGDAIAGRSRFQWIAYRDNLSANDRENRSDIPGLIDGLPQALGDSGDDIVLLWLSGAKLEAVSALFLAAARRALAFAPDSVVGRLESLGYRDAAAQMSTWDEDRLLQAFSELGRAVVAQSSGDNCGAQSLPRRDPPC